MREVIFILDDAGSLKAEGFNEAKTRLRAWAKPKQAVEIVG
nr:hypothetical protein [uncultured Kingella sp.]